jgi:hypothetical protein
MGSMFRQLWAMLTAFFSAGEVLGQATLGGATALKHLSTWAEESAGSFADQARQQRLQSNAVLEATTRQALLANGLAAPAQQPSTTPVTAP